MYRGKRVLVLCPAWNEEAKIGNVVARVARDMVDLLVIDDGSTDRTAEVARQGGATVLSMGRVAGVGAALRAGIRHAQAHGYDIITFLAGNDKDDPSELPRILDPVCDGTADLVMGSRYLAGGVYGGDMPKYRKLATRVHPALLGLFAGKTLTESTNGFRAIRLACLNDPRIHLEQRWLDGYGLEVYILYKMIKCGYRHLEVPCTKIYPPKKIGNTKMRPITGWWDILRPVFLLGLRLKR
jgi:dolichol-phosphate mannosyltransferase